MSEIVALGPELTRLLEWLPVAAFVRDRQGTLRHVNPALHRLTGAPIEGCLGRQLAEEDRRVFAGEVVHSETTFRVTGGMVFTMQFSKRQARHPEWGEVVVGIGCGGDGGRRSGQRDEAVALLRHELQSPLSAITGLADLLLQGTMTADQRESVRLIQASAGTCFDLVNDMLGVTRTSLDNWSSRPSEFSLREFLKTRLKPFELSAGSRGIAFSYTVEDAVPDRLYSDPLRLGQVLQNLVGNAMKFTDAGTIAIQVTGVADVHGGAGVRFSVSDTGIGISPEQQEAIFEPFVQAHGAEDARRYGGMGLGLSIAARIVKLLGGEIGVVSQLGQGSAFWFVIPGERVSGEAGSAGAGDGLDRKSALEFAGGDPTLLKELAELFLQEYPKLIADLRSAARDRDSKKLDTSAHALKGAVSNFGARAAVEAALLIEAKGRAGETEGLQEAVTSLEDALAPLLAELAAL